MKTPPTRPMTPREIELFVVMPADLDRLREQVRSTMRDCVSAKEAFDKAKAVALMQCPAAMLVTGLIVIACVLYGPKTNYVAWLSVCACAVFLVFRYGKVLQMERRFVRLLAKIADEEEQHIARWNQFCEGSRDYFAQFGIKIEDLPKISDEYHRRAAEDNLSQN